MRHLAIAARWPFGVLLTAWSYMWRTTPLWRREHEGEWPTDAPPDVEALVSRDGVQRVEDGAGPLLHRRYRARIRGAEMRADVLMETIKADPNRVAPGTLAHFEKSAGEEGVMRVGDEFVVRMPAPWDGPIRVADLTPCSFRVLTLDGHIEAGQIEWRARDEPDALVFEIESWARAGDRLSAILHDHLPLAKEVQLHMWTTVLERVAKRVGGRLDEGIEIETRRAAVEPR
jgi:hypothetical protein